MFLKWHVIFLLNSAHYLLIPWPYLSWHTRQSQPFYLTSPISDSPRLYTLPSSLHSWLLVIAWICTLGLCMCYFLSMFLHFFNFYSFPGLSSDAAASRKPDSLLPTMQVICPSYMLLKHSYLFLELLGWLSYLSSHQPLYEHEVVFWTQSDANLYNQAECRVLGECRMTVLRTKHNTSILNIVRNHGWLFFFRPGQFCSLLILTGDKKF